MSEPETNSSETNNLEPANRVSSNLDTGELLDILACPVDKLPLELSEDKAWLINARLGLKYPITHDEKGVMYRLLPESGEKL